MRLLVIEDTSSSSTVQITRSILTETVYSLDWHTISVVIDVMQKWLPLNYSFVHIQKGLSSLVQDNKLFRILSYFQYEQKNNLKQPFCIGSIFHMIGLKHDWMLKSKSLHHLLPQSTLGCPSVFASCLATSSLPVLQESCQC